MKPIDPNDLSKYLDLDAPTVPRPHLVPLSWHDVELYRTDDGLCAWRAYTCPVCCGTESDTRTGERCQCAGMLAKPGKPAPRDKAMSRVSTWSSACCANTTSRTSGHSVCTASESAL